MVKINRLMFVLGVLLVVSLFFGSLNFVSAQSATTCCERSVDGAYCQNLPSGECDSEYLSSPTSCDSTSFCQLGTCYDSDEGLCMQNTPRKACEEANGLWSVEVSPPQCDLGCCVLGEQAAYTTLQRCKKLAGGFGLEADFRSDVLDEISCIGIANEQDVGACVFESEFTRTCTFGTRRECSAVELGSVVLLESEEEGVESVGGSSEFYKDFLCTAEELNTNCQRTSETTCVDGKDEVYFLDTCGNIANIYDSSGVTDQDYWEKVVPKGESCVGNPDSCGNCDYLGGSICARAERGERADYGDFVCRDVNCYNTANGEDYVNGESWCFYDNDKPDDDRVGSRQYRHVCFMGEEIVESCADYRQEVCIEDSIGSDSGDDFSQAGCVINRWEDCLIQERRDDCVNSDVRDCRWIPVGTDAGDVTAGAVEQVTEGITGLFLNVHDSRRDQGACVPDVAPGLEFWGESASSQCDLVSSSCVVTYEKGLLDSERECVDNCFCDVEANPGTAIQALTICSSIGDCGAGSNYLGRFVNEGYEFAIEDEEIGPSLDLGIFNVENAVGSAGGSAGPSANPVFDQSSGGEFSGSEPAPPTGGVIRNLYEVMGG